jgi:hypothetical protein
MQFEL